MFVVVFLLAVPLREKSREDRKQKFQKSIKNQINLNNSKKKIKYQKSKIKKTKTFVQGLFFQFQS